MQNSLLDYFFYLVFRNNQKSNKQTVIYNNIMIRMSDNISTKIVNLRSQGQGHAAILFSITEH